jgi:flagellar assembly factor FliW
MTIAIEHSSAEDVLAVAMLVLADDCHHINVALSAPSILMRK